MQTARRPDRGRMLRPRSGIPRTGTSSSESVSHRTTPHATHLEVRAAYDAQTRHCARRGTEPERATGRLGTHRANANGGTTISDSRRLSSSRHASHHHRPENARHAVRAYRAAFPFDSSARTSKPPTLPTREDHPCPAMRLSPTSRVSSTVPVRRKRRRSSGANCWPMPGSPMLFCTSESGERISPSSIALANIPTRSLVDFFTALERCASEAEEAFRGRVEAILMVPASAAGDEDGAQSVPARALPE